MKNKDRFAALQARIDKFQAEISTEIARLHGSTSLLVQATKHMEEALKGNLRDSRTYNDQAGFEARIGSKRQKENEETNREQQASIN